MTYSANIQGHHTTPDWRAEEYELLRALVAAATLEGANTTTFNFNGNHIKATSIEEAKAHLAAYDAE